MDDKKLIRYFVKRFILVMIGAALAEMLVGVVLDHWIYPFLQSSIDWNILKVTQTSGSRLMILLSTVLWFLFQGILSLLPGYLSVALRDFLSSHWQSNFQITINDYLAGYPNWAVVFYYFGCLIILIAIVMLTLLPYLMAAYVYSQMIRTKIHQIVEEQKEAHIEYEQNRSLLLSDIAHDLKTPITTVAGYAQALSEGIVSSEDRKQEYLDAIQHKSMQMNDLIMLLFEYVKLESKGFALNKTRENLSEILRECIASIYSDLEKRDMELELDIPEEAVWYEVDRVQFTRSIMNLLNNALRHNEAGIRIYVRFYQMPYTSSWCIIIGDTGQPIAPEIAEHLFEPFVMGDKSRSSKGGSGLGMSISHKVMAMHGWELRLEQTSTSRYMKAFIVMLRR